VGIGNTVLNGPIRSSNPASASNNNASGYSSANSAGINNYSRQNVVRPAAEQMSKLPLIIGVVALALLTVGNSYGLLTHQKTIDPNPKPGSNIPWGMVSIQAGEF